MDPSTMYLTAFTIIGGIIFLVLFFHYVPFFLWLSAKVSGVNISLVQLFLMRIRNVPPYIIVPGLIEAHKAGLSNITRDELEAHYLAGGHVEKVVHALVSASKANIELPFQMATAIDLAGRDVFEAVQMSVNPKVIDTPPVTAVAKDGIQLIAKGVVEYGLIEEGDKILIGLSGGKDSLALVELLARRSRILKPNALPIHTPTSTHASYMRTKKGNSGCSTRKEWINI
jgi:uncharacterized protein YqfA (UPF0365 family)